MARPRHTPENAERLTIFLSQEDAERLRILAAKSRRPMTAIVAEAVSAYLVGAEETMDKERALRPVAPAKRKALPKPLRGKWTSEALDTYLTQMGISQTVFALALGVSQQTFNLWIRKRGIPDHRQAEITEALSKVTKTGEGRKG